MNIVRIPRLLKNSTLLLVALGSSFLLTACGGDSNNNSSSSSSSSSSVSSHTFSSTPVTPPLSGTWPDVKVSASGTKTLKFDWSAAPSATFYRLLKKADSNSDYVQIGSDFTNTSITDTVSVHLTDWVNSRYKVQACNTTGCQDSTVIVADSAMNTAITYLKASNTEANDWFGWSIAISGDGKTLAVGTPAEASNAKGVNGDQTSNTSPTSGAVYVFAKVNGNWLQEAYLKASNTEQPSDGITQSLPNPNARFGYQVDLSTDGSTLAVSALNEDSYSVGVNCPPLNLTYSSSASNSAGYLIKKEELDVGAVYVFKRTNTVWSQTAYIKPLVPDPSFGYSLALSGDGQTLAVGTVGDAHRVSGIKSYNQNSSSSEPFACLTPPSSASSVSSSSSSTSSSSSSNNSSSTSSTSTPGGYNSGAVYIYRLKDTAWLEDAFVKASDTGEGDSFGASIALSQDGNLMAVGAPGEDSKDTSATNDTVTLQDFSAYLDTGAVYVFQKTNKIWLQHAKVKPSKNEWLQVFGTSVALSADGNTLAVGAPGDWSKSQGVNSDSSNYTLEASIAYNSNTRTYYIHPKRGSSYATGAAYVFINSNATWAQQAYIKPKVSQAGFQFGSTVSLSGNGNVLAVGSWLESSLATGINGDQFDSSSPDSGAAYAFTRAGTTWAQKSYIKAPNSNALDRFGRALKLDDSGESLAVGAYRESSKAVGINGDKADNSAAGAGAAYIY